MLDTEEKELTFEESLSRLEKIVNTIENIETPLEEAMRLYREGTKLTGQCSEILGRYEAEVVRLTKEADGTFAQKTFDRAEP